MTIFLSQFGVTAAATETMLVITCYTPLYCLTGGVLCPALHLTSSIHALIRCY